MSPRAFLIVAVLLAVAAPLTAQEHVYLRRFADSVAVRQGEHARERVLYYFSPTAQLHQGDEVEQEGGAHSEVLLSAGGRIELNGPAHLIIETLDEAGDVLRFSSLSRLAVVAGDRPLMLRLPGDIRCEMQESRVDVAVELGRLRVRNTGALPVRIHGLSDPRSAEFHGEDGDDSQAFELGRGEEVRVPQFGELKRASPGLQTSWNGRMVWHDEHAAVSEHAGGVLIRARGGETARLSVAGVATRVPAGRGLIVVDRSRSPASAGASTTDPDEAR